MNVQNLPEVKGQLVTILKDSADQSIRSGAISAFVDRPGSQTNADTRQLMMNVLKSELSPARLKAGNEDALNSVMAYTSGLKRDSTVDQVMYSNLSRPDIGATGQLWTLKYYSNNLPLTKEEKQAVRTLILNSRVPEVQSWGRVFNLR